MTATPTAADRLAKLALEPVANGMIVGLGTGRTADRVTRALAQRILDEKLDVDCVCTSQATESLATSLGLSVIPFADVESVDYLVDGASEADPALRMLKGHSGAITRQRLVARVAQQRTYLLMEDRLTPRLGTVALLAVTIIPFGLASIRNALRDLGLSGVVRRNFDGEIFQTDGGGVLLDIQMPQRDPEELAKELDQVVGVVDHGLFLDEADDILVETKNGDVKRLTRE
jgi:ribose 5-phosphate isomerase A